MSKSNGDGLTIMVVEDSDDTRAVMKFMLEGCGYRVVEAVNGQEADEIAWRERPDLILMDLSLPMLDGLAATHRIRKQAGLSAVPIVIMSAHTAPEIRADALAAGGSEYVTKPIDFARLQDILDRLLHSDNPGADGMSRDVDV